MPEIIREDNDLKFTEEQWDAIAARDRNILVSAAAGSGKTAVLVRRITRMLTEGETSVDRILVVTFTRAAASEMKAKIVKAITDAKQQHPEKSAALQRQLDNMYRAQISTFDSFALQIVRSYFHVIGVDADISVIDSSDSEIMEAEAMDETFMQLFEDDYDGMTDFLRAYSGYRSEDSVKSDIVKLYDDLRSIPDYMEWFEAKALELGNDVSEFEDSPLYEAMRGCIVNELKKMRSCFVRARETAESKHLTEGFSFYDEDISKTEKIISAAESGGYDEIREKVMDFKPERLRGPGKNSELYADYVEVKDRIKHFRSDGNEIIKRLRTDYFSESLSSSVRLMNMTRDRALFLLKILRTFEDILRGRKAENGSGDFSDIMHYAVEILKDEEVAREYRERFDYILIDEYQDTNRIQERLIDSIKREDNVFMVGDIKQSIYRFRMADPAVFREKYDKYVRYDRDAPQQDAVIELNRNFRSKAGVIDSVNSIFTGMMDGYDSRAALYKGIDYAGPLEHKTELYLIDMSASDEDEDEDGDIDETIKEMKEDELEALRVAEIISENVGKTMIHDNETGKERPLRYSDIVILMRSVRTAGTFCQTIRDCGIELFVSDSEGYFDRTEIMTFTDLLRIIDNYRQDIPLLGTLRSSVFGFSIDDLTKIRAGFPDIPYHEALREYAENGADSALAKKAGETLSRIAAWKEESRFMPMSDFIWHVLTESGYYAFVSSMPGGSVRAAMLRAFAQKADHFSQRRGGGLYDLIRYIDNIIEKGIKVSQPNVLSENDDVVRAMTIHNSKGLEFPMVIYARTGKKFNISQSSSIWSFHNGYGFGLRYADTKNKWHKDTLGQRVIRSVNVREAIDEEKRLIYVALTRAEDKLVITGTLRSGIEDLERQEIKETNPIALIWPGVQRDSENFTTEIIRRSDMKPSAAGSDESISVEKIFSDAETARGGGDETAEINRRLSYQYESPEGTDLKSKYSVTELNSPGGGPEINLKVPSFRRGAEKMTAAEKGTAVHSVMQHLDFGKARDAADAGGSGFAEYINALTEDMVGREILTREEKDAVDPESIRPFFTSDIGKRAAEADILYRERPVTARHTLTDEDGEPREVLVQGTVDCYFEENGGIVLLDYKTNRNTENIKEMYQTQIDLYAGALTAITGKQVREAYLYLYSKGEFLRMI